MDKIKEILIRQGLIVVILILMLVYNYNGWDARDLKTVLAIFVGGLGTEYLTKKT